MYFVDDLYGNNRYYLGSISTTSAGSMTNDNNIYFSFRYLLNLPGIKYLMIIGNNRNFIINEIINIPITVQPAILLAQENVTKQNKIHTLTSDETINNIPLSTSAPTVLIGVYTTFDTPPNKTTPSNFLQTYGLYTYNDAATLLGPSYANYKGYLILQCDSISNGIPQTNTTLDTFTNYFISQLANKQIDLITVPCIFKDAYTVPNFVSQTHTFEYYNNVIFGIKYRLML